MTKSPNLKETPVKCLINLNKITCIVKSEGFICVYFSNRRLFIPDSYWEKLIQSTDNLEFHYIEITPSEISNNDFDISN